MSFQCPVFVSLQISNSFNISGTDEATLFKLANGSNIAGLTAGVKIGHGSGSRDPFKNFKPPSMFLEWMKLRSLNLAIGSTTASPTVGMKNFP